MIDKLWRKKYEFVADKNGQVIVKLDDGTYDIIWVWKDKPLQDFVVFSENGIKSIEDYCYFYDLIAQADKAERLQKQLDSLKKYSVSLRNRINKMLKKNKTLKNTAADYFMKSVELGIELEKTKSNN